MLGLSLVERDKHGGTCLHWAAFYGSENALDFLIAWNLPLDIEDNRG